MMMDQGADEEELERCSGGMPEILTKEMTVMDSETFHEAQDAAECGTMKVNTYVIDDYCANNVFEEPQRRNFGQIHSSSSLAILCCYQGMRRTTMSSVFGDLRQWYIQN